MYGDDNLISKEDVRKKIDSIIETEFHYIHNSINEIKFPIDECEERELMRVQGACLQLNHIRKLIYMSFNFERR